MKYTLITGAASGLGKELARIYAENGNNLLLIDYDEENLNKVNEELKNKYNNLDFKIYCCDLSNIDNIKEVYKISKEHDMFINNLVNCAGFGDCKDFKDMDLDLQLKMVEVDCSDSDTGAHQPGSADDPDESSASHVKTKQRTYHQCFFNSWSLPRTIYVHLSLLQKFCL